MAEIIAFGARKENIEEDRLKIVFGGLARFCEAAFSTLSEQPRFSLSWCDDHSDVRAAVNSRRMFEIFASIMDSKTPGKRITQTTAQAQEAIRETLNILQVHRSAEDISKLAYQAFSMPTGVINPPSMTMAQKRAILEHLRFTELAVFLG